MDSAFYLKLTFYFAIVIIASFSLLSINKFYSLELADAKKSDDGLPSEKQVKCFDKIAEKYAPESPPRDEIDRCYQY
jgi:hypothetical protein